MKTRSFKKTERASVAPEIAITLLLVALLVLGGHHQWQQNHTASAISRTQQDLKRVGIALESYQLDMGSYPPDFTSVLCGENQFGPFLGRLKLLTSPVAYMTQIPEAPFLVPIATSDSIDSTPWREGLETSGDLMRPICFDYVRFDRMPACGGSSGPTDSESLWENITQDAENVRWALSSAGPVETSFFFLGFAAYEVYDPTNGTFSDGNFLRTNFGASDRPGR